ncbi:hypothetical protein BST11_25535 [Mycobacterium alsense]|uniref:HNH endonuclease n=1 Tax=Mycobacterium alsense TaxID=324058 RepID=A0AA41XSL6_9MYCO|nr:HNH endonuclease [Mycobacterium alsense]OQZ87924.1 hypothetical protein BST11_25535 [Mycobacterium alsense]
MPYKDPAVQREYQRQWVARRRAEYLSDRCCAECGSRAELQVDHIDPRTKASHRIWSWSEVRLRAELDKCQVLCRTCHEAKSIEQQRITHHRVPYRHGTPSMYNRHGCRCGLCRLWKRHVDAARRGGGQHATVA